MEEDQPILRDQMNSIKRTLLALKKSASVARGRVCRRKCPWQLVNYRECIEVNIVDLISLHIVNNPLLCINVGHWGTMDGG
jgi:hypothetical protein